MTLFEYFAKQFEKNVQKLSENECWLWQGSVNRRGYGRIIHSNKEYGAHRVSWMLAHGLIPPNMLVCHHCDNPPCVNLNHLFLGTDNDNIQDKVKKGRARGAHIGEKHHNARLTVEDVKQIRDMYSTGLYSQTVIGILFGLSQARISRIVNRQEWASGGLEVQGALS